MGELWQRIGHRPQLAGLDQRTAARVLLRAGALTGWIGRSQQSEGAPETAKNLIGESLATFQALREDENVAEALTELSVCYWREGAYDEARLTLRKALSRLSDSDNQAESGRSTQSAMVEYPPPVTGMPCAFYLMRPRCFWRPGAMPWKANTTAASGSS